MTLVTVNSEDPTPVFEQIRRQVVALIDSGRLKQGWRLPPVRQLAGDLDLAPGTVARAYKELELGGYVETRRAAGTRVKGGSRDADPSVVNSPAAGGRGPGSLEALVGCFMTEAQRLGYSRTEIVDAVRAAALIG